MMLIPYVCCGDPDIEFTYDLVMSISHYADIIELGMPFSDPIADGRTIQDAMTRALARGTTIDDLFGLIGRLRKDGLDKPVLIMTYFNIIYAYGFESFLSKSKSTGVTGLIVPDLPYGEDAVFLELTRKYNIEIIGLIAPNTTDNRATQILGSSGLFTYLVSVAGTTGARKSVSADSVSFVRRIRALAGPGKKLAVGFGISKPEHVGQFATAGADGVIIGSAIINAYEKYAGNAAERQKALDDVMALVRSLKI